LVDKRLDVVGSDLRCFHRAECRIQVQPYIAVRLLEAMTTLALLISQVQSQQVAYDCVRSGNFPFINLAQPLPKQALRDLFVR
jgi:hypothetical protein